MVFVVVAEYLVEVAAKGSVVAVLAEQAVVAGTARADRTYLVKAAPCTRLRARTVSPRSVTVTVVPDGSP